MPSILHSMWFISVAALLAVDVRTGALQQREMNLRECHQCTRSNMTTCEKSSDWRLATCTAEHPYCGTIAVGPDFRSELSCVASTVTTCTLKYSENQNMELTCICTDSNCNVPFSQKLRSALTKFYHANETNSHGNMIEDLLRSLNMNLNDVAIYKTLTIDIGTIPIPSKNASNMTVSLPTSTTTTSLRHIVSVLPRSEALKHNAATLSDDDEDESEGSGSYEEARSHQAAAPTAPSPFLPGNGNKATTVCFSVLLIIPILFYLD